MKLTKETLKRIIKEELDAVLNEGAIYTPTGKYQILNPNNPDDFEAFKRKTSVIKRTNKDHLGKTIPDGEQIQNAARQSLENAKGKAAGHRPSEKHTWVYLAMNKTNDNYGWVWYDTSKAIEEYAQSPEEIEIDNILAKKKAARERAAMGTPARNTDDSANF